MTDLKVLYTGRRLLISWSEVRLLHGPHPPLTKRNPSASMKLSAKSSYLKDPKRASTLVTVLVAVRRNTDGIVR